MARPKEKSDVGSWSAALVELGLDHPVLTRLSSTRGLMEEAHKVHDLRRALRTRIADAEAELASLVVEESAATISGLELLGRIQGEVEGHTADVAGLSDRLRSSLSIRQEPEPDAVGNDLDTFIGRHGLGDQYELLLDMFSAFGAFDLRARAIRFHGTGGRMHPLPSFESIAGKVFTDDVRQFLQNADRVRLLITPAADKRIFAGVGKAVGFNNYAVTGVGSEGPDACANFIERLRDSSSGNPVTDDLLKRSPFEGMRVSLYSESGTGRSETELRGQGLGIETICEDITANVTDAADSGVNARPLSPPEYLLLQASRRRFGFELLDGDDAANGRAETWFPSHQVVGSAGTLVARAVASGLRFRADELGRGAEGRGYRMAYAPIAA